MGNFLSGYVPQTNYNGFVETPIPPGSDVAMVQLAVVNENGGAVGQLFLIYATYAGDGNLTAAHAAALKQAVDDCGEFPGGVGFLKLSKFTLILN